ncbi:MAG TPA: anti-sigma factor [Candidatus Limnocylindrales bacterium]|nr:anti-sigma factor [Candidatus Limnocylindrales bacterium]
MTCDEVRDLAAGFVLGALAPEDERAVRDHLETCPEPHAEIAELGGVVPYLAESVEPVEPPAGLKARILAAAAADLEARPSPASTEADSAPVVPFPAGRAPAGRAPAGRAPAATRGIAPSGWVLRIAAVLAVVVLGGWNLVLQGQLRDAQAYDEGVAAVLEVASRPGSQAAILADPDGDGPRGIAAVAADGSVVIAMRDLPATAGTEVYEAWVIGGDGVPVPIGDFAVGGDGIGVFTADATPASAGVTLALTREPAPGATTPTLPIVSAGVATSSPS